MEHKVISMLIDFFLENESPKITKQKGKKRQLMGSNYASPPLENLILTISFIARQQSHVDFSNGSVQGPKFNHLFLNSFNIGDQMPPLCKEDLNMLK